MKGHLLAGLVGVLLGSVGTRAAYPPVTVYGVAEAGRNECEFKATGGALFRTSHTSATLRCSEETELFGARVKCLCTGKRTSDQSAPP